MFRHFIMFAFYLFTSFQSAISIFPSSFLSPDSSSSHPSTFRINHASHAPIISSAYSSISIHHQVSARGPWKSLRSASLSVSSLALSLSSSLALLLPYLYSIIAAGSWKRPRHGSFAALPRSSPRGYRVFAAALPRSSPRLSESARAASWGTPCSTTSGMKCRRQRRASARVSPGGMK